MSDIEAKQGDVYGSEADNIPASVLDVMKNSGIGNTQTGSDVGDTEKQRVLKLHQKQRRPRQRKLRRK